MSNQTIEELLTEFPGSEYTREQFDADHARLLTVISAKHGIPESDVERLIREHDYKHSGEDPEDEYIGIMAVAHSAGWLTLKHEVCLRFENGQAVNIECSCGFKPKDDNEMALHVAAAIRAMP